MEETYFIDLRIFKLYFMVWRWKRLDKYQKSMYDFVKMIIDDKALAAKLKDNPILDFNTLVNQKTGAIKDDVHIAKYKNLEFKIYPSGRIEIKGSLHKYWNDGLHNWNDFSLRDVQDTIRNLQVTFNINPDKTIIQNLECGLNISPLFKPDRLLDGLVVYKKEPFNKMKTRGQGNGKEVYFSQYGIKIYNKGLQYKRPDNIVRFERKVFKMECIKWGLVKLSDLLSLNFAKHCLEQLQRSFEEVLITENVDKREMNKTEIRLFEKCSNPINWSGMKKADRYKNKGKFRQIIDKYGKHKYYETTYKLLREKACFLTEDRDLKRILFDHSINRSKCHYLLSGELINYLNLIKYNNAYSIDHKTLTRLEHYNSKIQFKNLGKCEYVPAASRLSYF